MRNIKYAFAIVLSAFLILISTILPIDYAYISGSFIGIGAALLGSFVVMWYETCKEDRKHVENRKNALSLVHTDITQVLRPLETAPKSGSLIIRPFSCVGWNIFTMSGSFNLEKELDRKIAEIYEKIGYLNAMVSWTASMQFTAARATTGIPKIRQTIDKMVQQQIEALLPILKAVKKEIEKELGLPQVRKDKTE